MEDGYLNVAYKDSYLLGEKSSNQAQHIWLKYSDNELKELAEVSPIIGSLKNEKFRKRRAYIHRDFEEKIKIK